MPAMLLLVIRGKQQSSLFAITTRGGAFVVMATQGSLQRGPLLRA